MQTQTRGRSSGTSALAGPLAAAFILLLLVGFGLGELTESTATASDLDAVRDVASVRSVPLTALAHAASAAGSALALVPLALIICVHLWRHARRTRAWAIAISFAGATAISTLVKLLVARPRPPVHHLEAASSSSFPSGHTTQTTAFCLALLLGFLATKPRRALTGLAALAAVAAVAAVALSRIYLGVHYPTDIAGGVVLASGWTVIAYALLARSHSRDGRGPGLANRAPLSTPQTAMTTD